MNGNEQDRLLAEGMRMQANIDFMRAHPLTKKQWAQGIATAIAGWGVLAILYLPLAMHILWGVVAFGSLGIFILCMAGWLQMYLVLLECITFIAVLPARAIRKLKEDR